MTLLIDWAQQGPEPLINFDLLTAWLNQKSLWWLTHVSGALVLAVCWNSSLCGFFSFSHRACVSVYGVRRSDKPGGSNTILFLPDSVARVQRDGERLHHLIEEATKYSWSYLIYHNFQITSDSESSMWSWVRARWYIPTPVKKGSVWILVAC